LDPQVHFEFRFKTQYVLMIVGLGGGLSSWLEQAVEAMLVQTLPTGFNMVTSGKKFGLTQPDSLSAIITAAATSLATGKQTLSLDAVSVGGPFPLGCLADICAPGQF
jgi:hypothetical protein